MLFAAELKKGEGIPLVFLHGFLGTHEDWKAVVSHLPDCCCIGFDLPGHGRSPFMNAIELPLPYFHLIGYSMGGRIALQYAADHPEKIASLTLLSTHPGLLSEDAKRNRLKSDRTWASLLIELPIDKFLNRWYNQPIFYPFKPDLKMRQKQNPSLLARSLLHYSLAFQSHFEIDQVLVGERDHKFRSLFQNPILIPNAGHAVHLEQPEFVAEIITKRIFP
jgi:2-succinyl-6-hydroxy-2,4-cyclohexadiene-1-carboxylate synthase